MRAKVAFKGAPLTLVGRVLRIGSIAPDFVVTAQDLTEKHLVDFKDKVKILTSFPSIDTPVCDLQIKEFNKKAASLSGNILIIGISKDLPFAQKRFCESFDIKNVLLFSDYKTSSFGVNYGLLIKELNLLARSVIILDKNDVIRYIQIVPELTVQPDYKDALSQLEQIIKNPSSAGAKTVSDHCLPCKMGTPLLSKDKITGLLAEISGWEFIDGKKIVKELKFQDFAQAKYFLDILSIIAEEQGHHPSFNLAYGKLKITLTTHAASGLTENDFIMAGIIDSLGIK